MTSDHLTAEELVSYQGRALPPAELLRVSDHLAECDECRRRIRIDFAPMPSINLSYEELVEYLDENIDPLRRRELTEKLAHSPQSRAELQDLAKFRDETNALAPDEIDDRILIFPGAIARWALPLAAAIALSGAGIWWTMRESGTSRVVALHDGDQTVLLKADGRVRGLSGMPPELLPLIATAMREEKLEIPETIAQLAGNREVLAGSPNELSEFQAKSPIATAVRERMPRFRWRGQPGATRYRIRIVDSKAGEIAMTGESDGPRTEWAPAEPLDAGKVYQWQVEALRDNDVIARSPKPPEPEARFKILSDNERLKVESVTRSVGQSHLALAIEYARTGLLDDAAEQLRMLEKQNPDSQVPEKLLAQIKATRSGENER